MIRGIVTGVFVGSILTAGNLFMGLKTGWWDSGMISAALLGFAAWNSIARPTTAYSKQENVLTITTAASMAVMPTAIGLLGALPALHLLGRGLTAVEMAVWGLALGGLGIALAHWLKERFLTAPSLTFPSAEATRQVLEAAYAPAGKTDIRAQIRSLLSGGLVAALLTWFRDGRPAFIPGLISAPGRLFGFELQTLSFGFSMSPMLLGIGMLVGLKVGLSLLLGALIGWAGLAPWAVEQGWVQQPDTSSMGAWLTAPGVALLIAGSTVPLLAESKRLAQGLLSLWRPQSANEPTAHGAMWAVAAAGAVVIALAWGLFSVHPLLGALLFLGSVVLIDVCVVSAGQSDILPLGAVGQFAQILLGTFNPGAPAVSIGGASIASGAAAQSAQTIYALKLGQATQVSPASTLKAQAVGVVLGTALCVPLFFLLTKVYPLGSAELPAPYVMGWKTLAELADSKGSALPGGGVALLGGALSIGIALALLERTRFGRWVPSPAGLGLAFLLPASNTITIALGSLLAWVITARRPAHQHHVVSAASGAIVGEGVMGVIVALWVMWG